MTDESLSALLKETDQDFNKMRETETNFNKTREGSASDASPPAPDASDEADTSPSEPAPPSPKPDELVETKRVVPEAVFLEEKKERARLERLYQEAMERTTRLDERYKIIEQKLLPPEPLPPDRAADPVGYLEHQTQLAQQTATTGAQAAQQLNDRLNAMEENQRLASHVAATEQAFAQNVPDYYDAVRHLQQARIQQYALAGLNEQQQQQALVADTYNWTRALMQNGKNAAEATYELAKTYGFGPKSAPADGQQSRNPDGTFAKPPLDPKVEQAKANLRQVAKGQETAKSLGDSVGASPRNGMPSPTELAAMDDDDFDKWTNSKNWKKFWN